MKKIVPFFLAIALILCCAPALLEYAFAAEVVATGSCGDNLTYTLTDDGVLTISGTGAMTDYTYNGGPWHDQRNAVTSVVIESGVTHIGSYAFYFFQNATSISVPDTVQSFGSYAFYYCNKLTSIYIPDGVLAIPDYCFMNCSLVSVDIPDSVTSIGVNAFYGCDFASLSISSSVLSIGNGAFAFCAALTDLYFCGSTPPTMGNQVFRGYNVILEHIWIPVGTLAVYSSDSSWGSYLKYLFEVGSEPHFKSVDFSQYVANSSQDSDALTKTYIINDGYYCGSSRYYASFIDGVDYYTTTSSNSDANPYNHMSDLKDYATVFYVGDIADGCLSSSASASVTYTATSESTYTGSYELYLYFYGADGQYLPTSGSLGSSSGSKLPSGANTLTSSGSFEFPSDAEYMVVVFFVGSFSGMGASDISFSFELTANYAPPVLPVEPSVSSSFSPSYSYTTGAAASALSVSASITDDGVLSYQWYENTINSTDGGTAISGATSASYMPATSEVGTKYYYCAVTNTLGEYTSTVYSTVAAVSVSKPVAAAPSVTSNFAASYEYKLGDTASSLSVTATVSDGGTLSYQWYILDPYGANVSEPISGATSYSYVPTLDYVGSRYYCCMVTNTLGDSTAWTESDWLIITVVAATQILDAGQWEAKTSVMTGEYLALASWPDDLGAVDLSYSVSGVACSRMSYQFDLLTSRGYGIYYDGTMAYSYGFASQEAGFISDAYALVFLEADQEVPTEFYEWFISCFEYVGADEEIPVYHTTINIYDNTGATLLDSFDTYGNGVSPTLYCSVIGNGFSLIYGTGYTWSWTTDSEVFFGFSTTSNTTVAWWVPGETFEAGGSPSNFTVSLYVVDSSGVSVDEEYQNASLNWFERIWQECSSTFLWTKNIYNIAKEHADRIAGSAKTFVEDNVFGFLKIIDFASIGDFFKNAYENLSTGFGLFELIDSEGNPFSWLLG